MPDPKTILILDDATVTAELIEDDLQKAGFKTVVETDLDDAIKGLKKRKWRFDLVVFDFWFTRITGGYEIFTLLKDKYPNVPAILFSKARWAIQSNQTPAAQRDLALQHFAELEQSGLPIVDKMDVENKEGLHPPPAERNMDDAIKELVQKVTMRLAVPEAH